MKKDIEITNDVLELVKIIKKTYGFTDEEFKDSKRTIIINMMHVVPQYYWIFPKIIFAKSMQKMNKNKIVVIDYDTGSNLKQLYSEFGIAVIDIKHEKMKNPLSAIIAVIRTIKLIGLGRTGHNLLDYKVKDIIIGPSIYDNIIRSSIEKKNKTKDDYTIDRLSFRRHFNKIASSLWTAEVMIKFFGKNKNSLLLLDVYAFDESIITKIAIMNDAVVYSCNPRKIYNIEISKNDVLTGNDICSEPYEREYNDLSLSDEELQIACEEYFTKRQVIGKQRVIERKDIISRLGLNPEKKNVVIMCNCYSDISFGGFKNFIFDDYYKAAEYTIRYVSELNNVNWIVKAHPHHKIMYNEPNLTYDLYQTYKSDSLFYFPDDWAGCDFSNCVDVIITTIGSGTLEYGFRNIPSVMMAETEYVKLADFIVAKSIEDYNRILENIQNIEGYSKDVRKKITKILYLYVYKLGLLGIQRDAIKSSFEVLIIDNDEVYIHNALTFFSDSQALEYPHYVKGLEYGSN